jgi:hypothetical protein
VQGVHAAKAIEFQRPEAVHKTQAKAHEFDGVDEHGLRQQAWLFGSQFKQLRFNKV